ncbi:MAG: hypothetical protein ACI9BJ_001004 [Flavobacteriales bacterium]
MSLKYSITVRMINPCTASSISVSMGKEKLLWM